MIDLQVALVADRIASLQREAGALRAERERDHRREHAASDGLPFDHPLDLPSQRMRLGRWLVALGKAIAGPRPMTAARDGEPVSAQFRAADDPCGKDDQLARAA